MSSSEAVLEVASRTHLTSDVNKTLDSAHSSLTYNPCPVSDVKEHLPRDPLVFASCQALSLSQQAFQFSKEQLQCPVVIEVFSGTARVTSAARALGLSSSFGADHDIRKAEASSVKLDLSTSEGLRLLKFWVSSPLVIGIFLAPPCGTCSLARNIKLRDSLGKVIPGPVPLRSPEFPEGLPFLADNDRQRVSQANKIYEAVASIMQHAQSLGRIIVVENPRSSLFWMTRFWRNRKVAMLYTAHQACGFSGSRPKWTVLAHNHPDFSCINKTCPGESVFHIHKPWGLVRTSEGRHFATSEETAYPRPLAHEIALTFARILVKHGWIPPNESLVTQPQWDDVVNLKRLRAGAGLQPKANKFPPLVREHKQILIIRGPQEMLSRAPVLSMQRIKEPWPVPSQCESILQVIPSDAQLLRSVPLRSNGEILQVKEQNSIQYEQAWGIPFSPDEFIEQAVKRGHPKSLEQMIPKILKESIERNYSKQSVFESRIEWFKKWTQRANELRSAELELKNTFAEHQAHLLRPKRILLWQEMLKAAAYPDMDVVEELVRGVPLTGEVKPTGLFEKVFKPAEMSEKFLRSSGEKNRHANFYSCRSSGDAEVDETVFQKTLEEVQLGWARGPISLRDLPKGSVISRRFGLKQPNKIRLIDDMSCSSINQTVQTTESLRPHTVDFISSLILEIFNHHDSENAVGRTYDMKSAYKQLAIASESLWSSYIAVFDPGARAPKIFQLLAAPFGATRSVFSFLRAVHSLWFLGTKELSLMWSCYFDDFVVLDRPHQVDKTHECIDMFFRLLGWQYATEGNKAESFSDKFAALGVQVNLSESHLGRCLLENTDKRKAELSASLQSVLDKGTVSVLEAQKLRGRMQFSDGQIFGRLCRLCMKELTIHAFQKGAGKMGLDCVEALERFKDFLEYGPPRVLTLKSNGVWYIFTDASYEPANAKWKCGLGGVLVDSHGRKIEFFSTCLDDSQLVQLGADAKHTIIFEAELFALILALRVWYQYIDGCQVVCFVDNNSARDVAISGAARNVMGRKLLDYMLRLENSLFLHPWFSRVPSPSNIADDPSRNETKSLVENSVRRADHNFALGDILKSLRDH